MSKRTGSEEIKALSNALSNFSHAMWERLFEKFKQGYRGWDNEEERSSDYIREQMLDDVQWIFDNSDCITYPTLLIDIANRAMILHTRYLNGKKVTYEKDN